MLQQSGISVSIVFSMFSTSLPVKFRGPVSMADSKELDSPRSFDGQFLLSRKTEAELGLDAMGNSNEKTSTDCVREVQTLLPSQGDTDRDCLRIN